jgi:hypothetical protein
MNKVLLLLLISLIFSFFSLAQGDRNEELSYFQNDQVIEKNKIEIYPNPAVENVFVKIANSELQKVEFELFNIIGNSLDINPEEISRNYYKIKVDDLPAGYYLLIVKDPMTRFNQAFKFNKVK